MKKSLLIASMAAICAGTMFAGVDQATYEAQDGLVLKNRWLKSRYLNDTEFAALPWIVEGPNYSRTATIANWDGKDVIVVTSNKIMVDGTSKDQVTFYVLDIKDGSLIKSVTPTLDGKTFNALLAANQIGTDDFNNIWFAGYIQTPYAAQTTKDDGTVVEAHANPSHFYTVDLATGACKDVAQVALPDDEASASGRIDYWDLVGDVTREQARCVIMALPSGTEQPYVYGWACEQGSDEWTGHFDGYVSSAATETYAAEQTQWGTAPVVRIVKDQDFSAASFYTDGFTTCPALYDQTMTMLDSFAACPDLAPKVGTNGVGEFSLNGQPYLVYSLNQYVSPEYCMVRVAKLGANYEFEPMVALWDFPTGGLGETSDGGARMHNVLAKIYTDASGVEGAYILTCKASNGIGVYTVAPEEWVDPNGDAGVEDVVADADANAPVEYFNLNGVKVNGDLAPGLYITRQGSKVAKKVVK